MHILLGDLAALVGGELNGNPNLKISGAAPLGKAAAGEITLADKPQNVYQMTDELKNSPAAAVLVGPNFKPEKRPYIVAEHPRQAFAKIVASFRPPKARPAAGISPHAVVSESAKIGENVHIGPLAIIGENVEIAAGCTIHGGAHIMSGCRIGENTEIFPQVVLYENTILGPRVILHSGTIIGAHGFGYDFFDGKHQPTAQLGHVEIGADVEIGANSTIDRGTYGATVIGEGTKLDNQVQVAHNCRIGRHNILCAQVGVAGSSTTGDYVVMAGQVGIKDHIHVGNQATIAAKSGVMSEVPEGEVYVGIPARPMREQANVQAVLGKLPALRRQVRDLERSLAALKKEIVKPQQIPRSDVA